MRNLVLWTIAFLGSAFPSVAENAQVIGGEHEDFTRLVVEAESADGWRFGRAADGYELALPEAVVSYDLTKAFDRIPKARIAALWQDPSNGRLRFSLACACYAVAFEFRPGTVVIDIRNGTPAEGSSFENPLDPAVPVEVASVETAKVEIQEAPSIVYDWVALSRELTKQRTERELPLPFNLPTGEVSLDPMRDALLAEISNGAVQGVVDLAEALPKRSPASEDAMDDPWSRISVGELPGLATGDPEDAPAMAADGRICLTDEELDVGTWGQSGPVATQIGLARSGIIGEFDAPSRDAILRAARFHVYLGFGAEARQYLDLAETETDGQQALLEAMAHIVDEEPVEGNPFAGMEACDTAAALWANFALGPMAKLAPGTNATATARSFSALPPHLRRHMGPSLVEKFLADGEQETARLVREAILRLPTEDSSDATLMDAKYQLAEGNDAGAAELAETVLNGHGPDSMEAAVTLVEASFRSDRKIDPNLAATLDVFLRDARETAMEAQVLRATALAHGMSGDFVAAFGLPFSDGETFSDLWTLTVEAAPDQTFLEFAAAYSGNRPDTRADVGLKVAERLLSFGFADLALGWLAPVTTESDPEVRLLTATALLELKDANAAINLLSGLEGAGASALRAKAKLQLGDPKLAAEAYSAAGDEKAKEMAAIQTQDWVYVREAGPENWKEAVDLLDFPLADGTAPAGSIANGKALAEESAAARATLEVLLAEAAVPEPNQ